MALPPLDRSELRPNVGFSPSRTFWKTDGPPGFAQSTAVHSAILKRHQSATVTRCLPFRGVHPFETVPLSKCLSGSLFVILHITTPRDVQVE